MSNIYNFSDFEETRTLLFHWSHRIFSKLPKPKLGMAAGEITDLNRCYVLMIVIFREFCKLEYTEGLFSIPVFLFRKSDKSPSLF